MPARGRPRLTTGARRYPSRLRALRERLGLSQEQVAQQAQISVAYYGALERGDKRINADTAQKLHGPLRCSVADLLPGGRGDALPLRFAIAAAELESRPPRHELPGPHEWLQLHRLPDPEHCFAAEIFDDSADRDFPRGTILCVRDLAGAASPLRVGAKIVVRFPLDPANGGETHEILYGILERSGQGELLLATRTRNRLLSRHAPIQAAAAPAAGLAEPPTLPPTDDRVAYARRDGDPGEILGVVVYSITPE